MMARTSAGNRSSRALLLYIGAILCCSCLAQAPPPPPSPPDTPLPIHLNGNATIWRKADLIYIWYGNSWSDSTRSILKTFGQALNGSAWFDLTRNYGAAGKAGYSPYINVTLNFVTRIGSGKVTSLDDANTTSLITSLIQARSVPWLPTTGVYVLFVAPEIKVDQYCATFCAYHYAAAATVNGTTATVPYIVVPSVASCWNGCSMYSNATDSASSNSNPEADGMINHLAHEISEAITDPYAVGGWYDDSQQENADKCAWQFGTVQATNGSKLYNIVAGGAKYLVQANWNPLVGANNMQIGCVLPPVPKASALRPDSTVNPQLELDRRVQNRTLIGLEVKNDRFYGRKATRRMLNVAVPP